MVWLWCFIVSMGSEMIKKVLRRQWWCRASPCIERGTRRCRCLALFLLASICQFCTHRDGAKVPLHIEVMDYLIHPVLVASVAQGCSLQMLNVLEEAMQVMLFVEHPHVCSVFAVIVMNWRGEEDNVPCWKCSLPAIDSINENVALDASSLLGDAIVEMMCVIVIVVQSSNSVALTFQCGFE